MNDRSNGRHDVVRRANREAILRAVTNLGPISRLDVVKETGLSKPTVLSIMSTLSADGLVRAAGASTGGIGRSAILFERNPRAAFLAGVDLGGSKVRAALAELSGEILAEGERPTDRRGGRAIVHQMSDLLRSLARDARVPWSKVAAVAVGIPGVSAPDGRVELAANIRGLEHLALTAELRRLLRAPVRAENDVNIAALGEQDVGVARGCSTFAVLALGTGVGLGLVVGGELVTGSRGAAGEIAYLPLGRDPRSPEARRRGALELATSGSGIRALLAAELDRADAPTLLTKESTARQVFSLAGSDRVADAVVAAHAQTVALAILTVAAIVDPELIVLAGGIGSNPVLLPHVRRAVREVAPFPIRVETSSLGTRAGIVGALALARRVADRSVVS